jgi:hypothetical protein
MAEEEKGLIEKARENVADAEDIVSGVVAPSPGNEMRASSPALGVLLRGLWESPPI